MDKGTPTVSVIIPAYNAEKYIAETIASVQGQTFADWELIVIDDCSQDSTRSIVEQLANEDSRIKFLKNETNIGVAETRNRAFNLCRGEWVALLDSDDTWYPEKLEKQLQVAKQENAEIVYCSYAMVDDEGKKAHDDFVVPPKTYFDDALIKIVISSSTALLHKNITKNYRFQSDACHEDYVFWMHLLKNNHIAAGVTDVCAAYRVHPGSRSFNKIASAINRWHVYRKYLKLPFFKSVRCITAYALLALKKYKNKK